MALEVRIVDFLSGSGQKVYAGVNEFGGLVTGPLVFDDTKFIELAESNTAYNFFGPKVGLCFIITGVTFRADKQVSSTVDASVVIYEASSPTSTTVDDLLLQWAVVQGDIIQLAPLRVLVTDGVYLNAKTTDDDIHMTIIGHYVAIPEGRVG